MNEVALGSLCSRVASGGTPSRKESSYFGGGIPWVKTMDLDDGPVVKTDETISTSGLLNSSAKIFPRGTVLVAMYGATVGKLGYLLDEAACNQAACALVPDTKTCDPRWLYYLLLSRRGDLVGLASGAAQQNLNVGLIRNFSVRAPSLEVQRAIGEVLGALDDKIAANRNLCSTLRELQESIWARESRTLPLTSLIALAPPKLGGTPARSNPDLWGGGVPWASVRDMTGADFGVVLSTAETITINPGQPERLSPVPAGSVFITARGTVGKVATAGVDCAFNQSAYAFVPQDGRGAALRLAVESAVAHLIARAHGSVFSTITTSTLVDAVVPDVSNDAARSLVLELDVLEQRLVAALRENGVLARTRDELLPLLMNGRITVKDAEQVVGDAL